MAGVFPEATGIFKFIFYLLELFKTTLLRGRVVCNKLGFLQGEGKLEWKIKV